MNKLVIPLLCILFLNTCIAAQSPDVSFIIAKDGKGNYTTVQEAFNNIADSSEKPIIVFIKNGIYKEKVILPASKTNVLLIGENAGNTILTYDDHTGRIIGTDTINTYNSFSTRIIANDFKAYNLTFQNSAGFNAGQAVALEINSDRAAFYNCRIIGDQDALFTNSEGRMYFKNCYIEGTTDFIFGKSTALFDSCLIYCKKDSYITAASTPEGTKFGYVYTNCSITHAPNISKVYLGRPWRDFAKTVFINCYLDDHIYPEGWHNWSKPWREKSAYYAEYKCFGPGADTSKRVNWSHQLTNDEASHYNIEEIFSSRSKKGLYKNSWFPHGQFSYTIKE